MNDKPVFIDSNVLIYAMDIDSRKKKIALDLLVTQPLTSLQVINECSNVLRKKFQLSYSRLSTVLENYLKMVTLVPTSMSTVRLAWQLGEKYGYSYYDSLVLASALENHCVVFYSEDLQHGQWLEQRLQIVNPFLVESKEVNYE
jgi:predicted nucleic acid-binding protein